MPSTARQTGAGVIRMEGGGGTVTATATTRTAMVMHSNYINIKKSYYMPINLATHVMPQKPHDDMLIHGIST
jgi:hypothetical protein